MSNKTPAFLQATHDSRYGFFAQFGGQGYPQYFEELRDLYRKHAETLRPLIEAADQVLKKQIASSEAQSLSFYKYGLEVQDWLTRQNELGSSFPPEDYLVSAPISYPLIFLSQMCHYAVTATKLFQSKSGSVDPIHELQKVWKGATGHSQGVVAATVVSMADTFDTFVSLSATVIGYMFWQGARLQQTFQYMSQGVNMSILDKDPALGKPSPLLTILGLPAHVIKKHMDRVNQLFLGASGASSAEQGARMSHKLEMSLINGPRAIVVSGHPATTLPTLVRALQQIQAKPEEDQSRVPFSKRKLEFRMRYLTVSVPFHSSAILKDSTLAILQDVQRLSVVLDKSRMKFPVYSTYDGSDVRQSASLLEDLIAMQSVQPVHWDKALGAATVKHGVTHVVDFGPGGLSGAGNLTARLKDGTGVMTILATSEHSDSRTLSNTVLFGDNISDIRNAPNWEAEYSPKLVRLRGPDGPLMIDTKFSRLIGKPPIMVAGMTPTTASEGIVAAFTNGGYHGELAGGGQATEQIFKDRIKRLTDRLTAGEGIHLNLLFLNPKLWGFQFPMSLQMRKEGIPIDSLTVAAGIPSLDRANEIIESVRQSGMRYLGFKPGSVNAIKEVLQIAKGNPDIHIVLQWTGGRAGGHHSFEDTYEPILSTYSSIRRHPNVVLVVGGGIGDSAECTGFLTGTWSTSHGYPPMPFDGLLLGSRVMVAKEALTADEAKELIAKTTGVHDKEWEKSYEDDAGGVITVISELGEPIHKIATRGVLLWREMDKRFFLLPREQQERAILDNKDYIIKRLNNDYQKVYFGRKRDRSVADLDKMTYSEVLDRMVELMYIENEWIHSSYRDRFISFLSRTEERLLSTDRKLGSPSIVYIERPSIVDPLLDQDPRLYLHSRFCATYPSALEQILSAEDVDYFLYLCKERGKPVNFVPVIDKDLSFWFKKDSLWQSENLKFVQDRDVQRVCILQGPVAVRHSTTVNEPVADILNNLNRGIIENLRATTSSDKLPVVEYLGYSLSSSYEPSLKDVHRISISQDMTSEKILSVLRDQMFPNCWLRALLCSSQISTGVTRIPNRVPQLLVNHPVGTVIQIATTPDTCQPLSVQVVRPSSTDPVVTLNYDSKSRVIRVTVLNFLPPTGTMVPLTLEYSYHPEQGGYSPIHMDSQNDKIKGFYHKLWFPNSSQDYHQLTLGDTFTSTKNVRRADLIKFCDAIGTKTHSAMDPVTKQEKLRVPIDYVIVACWESMIISLFPPELDCNLLSLLHLSYGYRIISPDLQFGLWEGDEITSSVKITEVMNVPNGKRVGVLGTLRKEGAGDVIEVTSQFFFPGSFSDFETNFRVKTTQKVVTVSDQKMKAVLLSKPWLQVLPGSEIRIGDKLLIAIESTVKPLNEKVLKEVRTTGQVSRIVGVQTLVEIAEISFQSNEPLTQDPVEAFLDRHGKVRDSVEIFEDGGYPIPCTDSEHENGFGAPRDNLGYSIASGDHNPIHTNQMIADLAGLPATIVHGMWNAAYARTLLDTYVSRKWEHYSVTGYQATFMEKVKPGDRLFPRISHVGMKNGRKMITVELLNEDEISVLRGTAEVEQPRTAYVFTGQGSAEIGMGMDLYRSSGVARDIWDRAEGHMMAHYGFSLMQIINKNPKELTIYFGGPMGASIREHYMNLKHEIEEIVPASENGGTATTVRKLVNLFPEITEVTEAYTFHHPEGLLFATQFTQPALTLVEKASFADMESRGLVDQKSSYFAGHSLGEYAALASVANVLSVENLVELVFIRGITMQNAVHRDEHGRSHYGMVAVNPQRVGPYFTPDDLHHLVDKISEISGGLLLQVVNYNVENWQYIVTGHLVTLEALRLACGALKKDPLLKNQLDQVISEILKGIPHEEDRLPFLQNGVATIPLPGIDVPFHSRSLLSEVPRFREYLMKTLSPRTTEVPLLEHRYIPNLTAVPFEVSLEYAQLIMKNMKDSILHELLATRSYDVQENEDDRKELGYYLTVELLAFQFASPVRWVETQDYFFNHGVERVIEIGPATTLKGMAQRTLSLHSAKYGFSSRLESLSFKTDKEQIYYEIDPQQRATLLQRIPPIVKKQQQQPTPEIPPTEVTPAKAPAPVAVAPVTPAPAPVAAAPAPTTTPATSTGGGGVSSFETLQVLLAIKLKKTLAEITGDTTIKDLVGGKSAIQNEILGDLQKEFGQEPEGAATLPLKQLAQQMSAGYSKLGTQSNKLIARVLSSKMPAGFGLAEIQDYLSKERDISESQIESVLLHTLMMEPDSRIDSIPKSKEWLDQVTDNYCTVRAVTIPRKASSSGGAGGGMMKAIDSEELYAYQRKHDSFLRDQLYSTARYLDLDLRDTEEQLVQSTSLRHELENDLNVWELEHGKAYAEGIRGVFDAHKIRRYNSSWNWARQEAFSLFYDTLRDNPARFDSQYCKRVFSLTNRGTPELVTLVEQIAQRAYSEGNPRIGKHIEALAIQIRDHLHAPPVFRVMSSAHDSPHVEVNEDGRIIYSEIPRNGVRVFDDYVKEMRRGYLYKSKSISAIAAGTAGVSSSSSLYIKKKRAAPSAKAFSKKSTTTSSSSSSSSTAGSQSLPGTKRVPYIFLRAGKPEDPTEYDISLTNTYYNIMSKMAPEGISFQNKTALVTGCGKGSIGLELVKGLLAGGARVIITTSRFTKESTDMYRGVYEQWGAKDSELILFPFNQASSRDVNDLVTYIYEGLSMDLDYLLPFAAVSEIGRDITNLDSLSELSHRVMLTNLLRLIGKVKSIKQDKGIATNPTYVVLPLSPNHGVFGSDGLYAESKLGLETLFNKWESEGWQNYLSLTGAVIGWTRGTGLMEGNNMVAEGIEHLNVRTFNQTEMAYSIIALLAPEIVSASQKTPIWADITGGMGYLDNLKNTVSSMRQESLEKSEIQRAIRADRLVDESLIVKKKKTSSSPTSVIVPIQSRANLRTKWPTLPTAERLESLKNLRGMVDLRKTPVIVGLGEVSPWGNARTRWDIEMNGEFSVEGCIELAWIMGLIKYHNGPLKDGTRYVGWVDAKSGAPVKDSDIKSSYESTILNHCGIREIEPDLFEGYNPHKKMFLHEVAIHHDLEPVEVFSKEEAQMFKHEHGDRAHVFEKEGRWYIQIKKGAAMYIPRAIKFDRFVAGQVPTGWDASLFGIPKDIIDQVDKVTLYNLVSTAEALISAGVTDPYEFYQYVHVSQIGNTAGGGIGGLNSIRRTYRERLLEKPIQADILQEIFINVMPAWVNLLLLSASGPVKTPVGACATAAESVELGVECITSGKARIVVVGGYDDFGEESSYEFAQMKATSNSAEEVKMGRVPKEMSRPVSDTRAGFMESQGAGTEILMDAELALLMGVPIYGIVALTNTAMDKVGRSVPAPGRGLLTTAREKHSMDSMVPTSMLLDIEFRKRQLETERQMINTWKENELKHATSDSKDVDQYRSFIEEQANRKERAALALWGNEFYVGNEHIAPLRGALAVWGLTVDDLGVASFHGTGTKANDFNESMVTQYQLDHLGRKKGNGLLTIFQKYLTGHPKGAAAAWMLNGLCQSLLTGVVPGNRNADNVDHKLRACDHLVYTTKSIQTTGLKAGVLKSFGFGQASAEILVIHPDYLFAVLEPSTFEDYAHRRHEREVRTFVFEQQVLAGKKKMISVKDAPPYTEHSELKVYLDPAARAAYDPSSGSWKFPETAPKHHREAPKKEVQPPAPSKEEVPVARPSVVCRPTTSVEVTMRELAEGLRQPTDRGIGVDVQLISELNVDDPSFITRNFTETEINYCTSADTNKDAIKARFAGRWAAKEAVIKAISSSAKQTGPSLWKGSGAPLKDIEILATPMGPPTVQLHGYAARVAQALAISEVKVTISHSGEYAVANAVTR